MHDFSDRSGADRAGIEDPHRDRVEQQTCAFEGGRLPARYEQQVSRLCAFHPARHRRVQHCDASGGEHVMDPPDKQGGIRCVVDVEPARLNDADNPAWTEADLLHLKFSLNRIGDGRNENSRGSATHKAEFCPELFDPWLLIKP